ncbi:MAG: hypothetical protein IKK79_02515, partial [Spirochaetaceae bacterium]|nr:hypothetical protein [Spirochaetaceae bacterium]
VFTSACASYYKWLARTEPEMFERIKEKVKEGRWSVTGGMWVQPDCNIPSGEAFARHFLYSQKFFKENFGFTVKTSYNVDSFGHNGMYPQLLIKSGIENYVYHRPDAVREKPGMTTEPLHMWESPDGSRVLCWHIPDGYGGDIFDERTQRFESYDYPAMFFYGVGNHGGGPTIEALDKLEEMRKTSPEKYLYSSPEQYFADIRANVDTEKLDIVKEDLQHHASGCYSANSKVKALNRRAEEALVRAEKMNGIGEIAARLSGGYMSGWTFPYSSDFFLTQQAELIALGREPAALLDRRRPVEGLPENLPFTVYEVASTECCGERAWISIPGKVKAFHGLERARACVGVKDVLPRAKIGDTVTFPRNNVEKCGNILAVDTSWEGAASKAQQAVKAIVLQLEPHQAETDSFLSLPPHELRQENSFPPAAFVLPPSQREELTSYLSSQQGDFDHRKTLLEQLPPCLVPSLDFLVDWNYRSLRETLLLAQEILDAQIQDGSSGKSNPSLVRLWQSCILGGVQGLLYVIESSH